MTDFLFRADSYMRSADATVLEATHKGGVLLDQTIFYAASGGQPGDTGEIRRSNGTSFNVVDTVHPNGDKTRIAHLTGADADLPAAGEKVTLEIDWERRHRLMRMHSALHLLSVVFAFPVTGGQVGTEKGRLDFDMPEVPGDLPALEAQLNAMIADDHPVLVEWISDQELAEQPQLIKTMAVKPPMGQGQVRLVRIGDVDLQPCGGTHVRSTAEIGPVRLGKVEKKGKINRRVSLHFA
ncbi:Ala-tRNA(Pro) hydrolase [Devosia pacifica]|uniref:Alanine--tRNA ligase n=1 Tax=Devosia pacifica TaxID=1335967 RepID=A0A918RV10_9HYPH|nr:alanyl-tRNA editing protein [Devosia pacifica]GHA10358.1 Ala-tRNA(Pro) hydrolase [Devosia pacifica]